MKVVGVTGEVLLSVAVNEGHEVMCQMLVCG